MTNEVEYKGIKIKGGKLLLIFPLLGTLGGAIWAGFEGYARWSAMEDKINSYEAPNISHLETRQDVLDEKLSSIETLLETKITNMEQILQTEISTAMELVGNAQDDARSIKTDLRSDVHNVLDEIAGVDKRSRTTEQELRSSIRTSENEIKQIIQHAEDRFDQKRTSIEEGNVRLIEKVDVKLSELEKNIKKMLERALNNPLAGN